MNKPTVDMAVDGLNVLADDFLHSNRFAFDEHGALIERDPVRLQMLMVSEIAEAMEAYRKDLPDDKLPHRLGEEVEMADLLIRALEYCGYRGFDIAGAVREKLEYNKTRVDHDPKVRAGKHGKKF